MLQVDFVAQHEEWNCLWVLRHCFQEELLFPYAQIVERFRVRDIEYEYASFGAAVKCPAERLKALLAGGVPNLQRHHLEFATILDLQPLRMEIRADGWLVHLRNAFTDVVLDNTCLSDCAVAQHHDFEDVVFLLQILLNLRPCCALHL